MLFSSSQMQVWKVLALRFAFVCPGVEKQGLNISDKGLIIFRNATFATQANSLQVGRDDDE